MEESELMVIGNEYKIQLFAKSVISYIRIKIIQK